MKLNRYSACLACYCGSVAALSNDRMDNLAAVALRPRLRTDYETNEPPSDVLSSVDVLGMAFRTGPSLPLTPWSDHVHKAIRPALADAIPDDARYDELFDMFEMILAAKGRGWGGRFVWSRERGQRDRIKERIMASGADLVRIGFFANTNELETAFGALPSRWG